MYPFRRLIVPVMMLLIISVAGLMYYMFGESWSFIDSLYMIVITLTTVGFKEARELSEFGKLVTAGIIVIGVGTFIYTAGQIIEIIFEGQIVGYRRRKEMEKKINEMKNHYIICGFGRVGHRVAEEFDMKKIPYVVIDSKPETAEELGGRGIPYIVGDISSDEILESAGVKCAKGLISCADSDTSNVYVILAARVMSPDLYIVARASQIGSESKMKRAGANRTLSPYFISGSRMAAMALKPVACQFLDTIIRSENLELEMEEYLIQRNSKLIGKTLSELQVKQKTGALVVAIKRTDGKLDTQPGAKTDFKDGDILVALGASDGLKKLRSFVS